MSTWRRIRTYVRYVHVHECLYVYEYIYNPHVRSVASERVRALQRGVKGPRVTHKNSGERERERERAAAPVPSRAAYMCARHDISAARSQRLYTYTSIYAGRLCPFKANDEYTPHPREREKCIRIRERVSICARNESRRKAREGETAVRCDLSLSLNSVWMCERTQRANSVINNRRSSRTIAAVYAAACCNLLPSALDSASTL